MTEDELAALEEAAAQRTRIIGTWAEKDTVFVSTADAAFLESARAAVPALIAEVRRLRAAGSAAIHECSQCDTVGPCKPEGYEWSWVCADDAACRARFEAKHPWADDE